MFLWAVAMKKLTRGTLQHQLVDTPPVERWCMMVHASCFGPSARLTSPALTPTSPTHLDIHFGTIVDSLECLTQLTDERMKQEQTDKEPKGFKKL